MRIAAIKKRRADQVDGHRDYAGRLKDAAVDRLVGDYPLERLDQRVSNVVNEVYETVGSVCVAQKKSQSKTDSCLDGHQSDTEECREDPDPAARHVPRPRRRGDDLILSDCLIVHGPPYIPLFDRRRVTAVLVLDLLCLPSYSHFVLLFHRSQAAA